MNRCNPFRRALRARPSLTPTRMPEADSPSVAGCRLIPRS
jgi:hypothetical protein